MKLLLPLILLLLQACNLEPGVSENGTDSITSSFAKTGSSESSDVVDSGQTEGQTGNLEIRVTDAPFPYEFIERADVEISKVTIRGKNGTTTISETPTTYNLIELRAGLSELLSKVELPVGSYDLLRMYVTDASITLKSGKVFNLKVPSGPQSGIKVFLKPKLDITANSENTLTLDFDLAKSFVLRGNQNKLVESEKDIKGFIFKPVVRATYQRNSGGLQGTILSDNGTADDPSDDLELDNVHLVLQKDGEEVATTSTIESGRYQFNALEPGDYTLVAEIDGHQTYIVGDVEVVVGEVSTVGDITLQKEAEDEGDDVVLPPQQDPAGSIQGTVISDNGTDDPSDDYALDNVQVTLQKDGEYVASTPTTDSGSFQFNDIEPGDYTIVAEVDGHQSSTVDVVSVVDGEVNTLADIPLQQDAVEPPPVEVQAGGVQGSVLSNNGTDDVSDDFGLSNVLLTLIKDGAEVATTTTTDSGSFLFNDIEPGEYTLTAEIDGHQTFTVEVVRIINGEINTISDITLQQDPVVTPPEEPTNTFTLSGTVMSDSGTPYDPSDDATITGATITVADTSGNIVATTTTAADGTFSIDLEPGNYIVTISDMPDHLDTSTGLEFNSDLYVKPTLRLVQ